MANLIDPGKEYRTFLETIKKPVDEPTIRQTYSASGLIDRLGTWRGTAQQYNALLALGRTEQTLTDVRAKTAALGTMVTQALKAKEAGVPITPTTQYAPTKEFAQAYPDLAKQELGEQAIRLSPTGVVETLTPGGEWKPYKEQIAAEAAVAGKPFVPGEPSTAPLGTLPLTPETIESIITKISTGEITTPEFEIAKETVELAKSSERARVAAALEQTQQTLATRGMTFSGIRTQAEARIQAEHLANMAGISLKLASAIIQAAREEQTRTRPTYQSVGGSLYEIIPGQEPRKIIEGEPRVPTIIGTSETGYFQWNPQTQKWESTGIQVTGQAPTVIGSAQTGYYQWDTTKQTWVATGIKATEGITPITIGGKIIDISSVDGLSQAEAAGLDRATARSWLDIFTDYTTPTIDNMLETIYGKELPTSVSGQQQELAKDIMALDIASVNTAASSAKMNPKEYVKEKIIKPSGFNPDDDYWKPFLDKFTGAIGTWFSGQIKEIKQAMELE